MLWAVFTLIAAAAQTARNAMQRELTATLATAGATHVRFLFGFPFALVFLAGLAMPRVRDEQAQIRLRLRFGIEDRRGVVNRGN